ncbi:MAG: hypothetical protein E7326_07275 [Clostridiales bacterium]|nr:hypothetical protein [Clostridiales bacterium]
MKRFFAALLSAMAISAVFVCACASQLAQAWYMYPELREIIESDDVFENYNAIAHNYLGTSQQRAVAILSSPFVESRMLLLERDGEGTLQIRDQLFAPLRGDTGRMGSDWTVKSTGQGFQLINSDEGQTAYEMTFVYDENRAGYVLEDAVTPQMAFCYDATVDGYMAEDPDGYDRMFWYGGRITLEEFCPDMLPDSYDEVWTSRVIRAGLADLRPISAKMPLVLEGDDKMAVYAAPSSKAYRGANGKACVYADEEIWIRGQTGDGKWWLVEYTVSDDRGRIGYIKARGESNAPVIPEEGKQVRIARHIGVTDGPYQALSSLFPLKTGDQVTCLGYVDAFRVYVEAKTDGKTARGYIPIQTLALPDDYRVREMEEKLIGTWRFGGGGEVFGYGTEYRADGTCILLTVDEDYEITYPPEHLVPYLEGTYAVYPHQPVMPGWWQNDEYLLVFTNENGFMSFHGLRFIVREEDGAVICDLSEYDAGGSYAFWK